VFLAAGFQRGIFSTARESPLKYSTYRLDNWSSSYLTLLIFQLVSGGRVPRSGVHLHRTAFLRYAVISRAGAAQCGVETTNLKVSFAILVSIRRKSTAYSTNVVLLKQTVRWLNWSLETEDGGDCAVRILVSSVKVVLLEHKPVGSAWDLSKL
jgi:hypothetical protein